MKLDVLADGLHKVLVSDSLEGLALVRVPRDLARRLNRLAGSPLAPRTELEARRAADAKLRDLRAKGGVEAARALVAPVIVYVEKGRNDRELRRVEELLEAKGVSYTLADVTNDDATLSFVLTTAGCEKDQLPVVFVAGEVVGPYNDLVAADVAGKLDRMINGARPS